MSIFVNSDACPPFKKFKTRVDFLPPDENHLPVVHPDFESLLETGKFEHLQYINVKLSPTDDDIQFKNIKSLALKKRGRKRNEFADMPKIDKIIETPRVQPIVKKKMKKESEIIPYYKPEIIEKINKIYDTRTDLLSIKPKIELPTQEEPLNSSERLLIEFFKNDEIVRLDRILFPDALSFDNQVLYAVSSLVDAYKMRSRKSTYVTSPTFLKDLFDSLTYTFNIIECCPFADITVAFPHITILHRIGAVVLALHEGLIGSLDSLTISDMLTVITDIASLYKAELGYKSQMKNQKSTGESTSRAYQVQQRASRQQILDVKSPSSLLKFEPKVTTNQGVVRNFANPHQVFSTVSNSSPFIGAGNPPKHSMASSFSANFKSGAKPRRQLSPLNIMTSSAKMRIEDSKAPLPANMLLGHKKSATTYRVTNGSKKMFYYNSSNQETHSNEPNQFKSESQNSFYQGTSGVCNTPPTDCNSSNEVPSTSARCDIKPQK